MNYFASIEYGTGKVGYAYKTVNKVPGSLAPMMGIVHAAGVDKIEVYYNINDDDTLEVKPSNIILIAKFKDVPMSEMKALEGKCLHIRQSVWDEIYALVREEIKVTFNPYAFIKEHFNVSYTQKEDVDYCI
jgi:hypothetical protein